MLAGARPRRASGAGVDRPPARRPEQKNAVAVAHCKRGRGLIRVNGSPIELLEPEPLRLKAFEPVLLLGRERFANLDIRIRVRGGGHVAQVYAVRQAIAKALVAFHQKCACSGRERGTRGGGCGATRARSGCGLTCARASRALREPRGETMTLIKV